MKGLLQSLCEEGGRREEMREKGQAKRVQQQQQRVKEKRVGGRGGSLPFLSALPHHSQACQHGNTITPSPPHSLPHSLINASWPAQMPEMSVTHHFLPQAVTIQSHTHRLPTIINKYNVNNVNWDVCLHHHPPPPKCPLTLPTITTTTKCFIFRERGIRPNGNTPAVQCHRRRHCRPPSNGNGGNGGGTVMEGDMFLCLLQRYLRRNRHETVRMPPPPRHATKMIIIIICLFNRIYSLLFVFSHYCLMIIIYMLRDIRHATIRDIRRVTPP